MARFAVCVVEHVSTAALPKPASALEGARWFCIISVLSLAAAGTRAGISRAITASVRSRQRLYDEEPYFDGRRLPDKRRRVRTQPLAKHIHVCVARPCRRERRVLC